MIRGVDLGLHPDNRVQLEKGDGRGRALEVDLVQNTWWKSVCIHLEADLERRGRVDRYLDDVVQVKRVGPEPLVAKRLEAKNLPPVGDRLCGGGVAVVPADIRALRSGGRGDDSARDALFTQPAAAIITASWSAIVSLRPTFPHGTFEQALTPSIAVAIVTSVTQSGREVNGASPADSAVRS